MARDVSVLLRRGQGNNPYSMATTRLRAVEELLAFKSSVIWLVTPQETFRSGSGYYNASALGQDAAGACARRVPGLQASGARSARSHASWRSSLGSSSSTD